MAQALVPIPNSEEAQNDYAYNDALAISFEKGLAVDIEYAKTLLAIAMHAADDWNKEVVASRVITQEGSLFDFQNFSGGSWTINDLIRSDEKDAKINVVFDKVQRPVEVLSLEEYRSMFSDDYDAAIKDSNLRGEPAVNFAMARRAANFREVNIGSAVQVPAVILQRFNQLANAAVTRKDVRALTEALDPAFDPAILGRFAAVLLKRDFQIVRYQANADDANAGSVVGEYYPLETGTERRRATFQFHRAAPASPWLLAGMDLATQAKD